MSDALPEWLEVEGVAERDFSDRDVALALGAESPGLDELACLLSPAAAPHLEEMAARAQALTQRHFGRTVSLYAPLYLSNYCSSGCVYCGYAADRDIPRRRLELDAVEAELDALKTMGFEEVLLLTGERCPQADFTYLSDCVGLAATRFHMVTIEAFPMDEEEYRRLARRGCTGVTLYQETYERDLYATLHRWGPKRDWANRIDAPARALRAGMRAVGLGALLGLSDPRIETLRLYRHADALRREFWRSGIALSFPRIRPQAGGYCPAHPVEDRFLARMIYALRICLPDVPLVLSTRESPRLRDGLAGVGISKMSAASRTTVGGYGEQTEGAIGQFEVCDNRDVAAVCASLRAKGLEPVFKNWDMAYRD